MLCDDPSPGVMREEEIEDAVDAEMKVDEIEIEIEIENENENENER